jgi:lipoprotein-anchoring transpeptidase ErfK/SrfK
VTGFEGDTAQRVRLAVLVGSALLIAGCTASETSQPPKPPSAQVVANPADNARDVSPATPITMGVTGGKLTKVALTSSDGNSVPGKLTPDGLHWTPSQHLDYGKTYTWSGDAVGIDGRRSPVTGKFTTVTPANVLRASLNIDDGGTVGVAAPIAIQFDGPVQDKAAVERALSVHTSVPIEGSWAWLPDSADGSRVHWRPKNYWKADTQVTVNAALFGVPYGNGVYGKENLTGHFTIGRSQVVKADASSHRLVVERDGKQVADYPASYGMDSAPDRNTRSGVHVVTGKSALQRMTSQQYGYDTVEPWAVQINNNGEFIHTNTETVGMQGSSNVTHGCINLSADNGHEYFESAMYGDPVEVTNTGVQLSASDGDIYDWTVSWGDWQAMSALKKPQPAPAGQAAPAGNDRRPPA